MPPIFVSEKTVISQTSLSRSTLYRLRQAGRFEVGIHYVRVGRMVRYQLALIQDWIANQHQPEMHDRAIGQYLSELPSSQITNKKPGREPGRSSF